MTSKDIEKIIEEFFGKFAWCDLQNSKDNKRMNDWLRTTINKHHEAEVEMVENLRKRADMEIYALENTLEKAKELSVAVGYKRVYERLKIISEYIGKLEAWREVKKALTTTTPTNN